MPLSDIVNVQISVESAGAAVAGFGIPMIMSANATFPERIRFYSALSGMVTDGFTSTTPEYKAAAAMFAQVPAPASVAVGRLALKPTQRWKITIASVLNSTAYKIKVGSNIATFTSDANATNDEITAGLVSAVNALSGDTLTATEDTSGGAGFHWVVLTGNAAGNWNEVEILDSNGQSTPTALSLMAISQDHADPGAATDLAAIKDVDNSWYGIVNLYNSKAMVLAIAAWAESNEKLFLAGTQDSAVVTTAVGGTDVADDAKDANYFRTSVIYHPNNAQFVEAAWAGKRLPTTPGSETWANCRLAGVTAVSLTDTHIVNLKAKNANYYYTVAGVAITRDGKVAAGEWIDIIRFRDWQRNDMAISVFNLGVNASETGGKIPMTDEGISMVEGEMRGSLLRGRAAKGIAPTPDFTIKVPKASEISSADKAARLLKNCFFNAPLAGAVHVTNIQGTFTL